MPRTTSDAKDRTRQRLLEAAGRDFRARGYGGVGIDGVADAAGVTSGAVYAHFGSKAAIFRAALERGLDELRDGVDAFRREYSGGWLRRFATWYIGAERRGDLATSCALATLTLEAARSDDATRLAYDARLAAALEAVELGIGGPDAAADAVAVLALLSGGMAMAHAVRDPLLAARIADAVAAAVAAIGDAPRRDAPRGSRAASRTHEVP